MQPLDGNAHRSAKPHRQSVRHGVLRAQLGQHESQIARVRTPRGFAGRLHIDLQPESLRDGARQPHVHGEFAAPTDCSVTESPIDSRIRAGSASSGAIRAGEARDGATGWIEISQCGAAQSSAYIRSIPLPERRTR